MTFRTLVPAALVLVLAGLPALGDDVSPPGGGGAPSPAAEAKAPAAEAEWLADFDKAVEKAKAEKKDLLVDFTGSDWCGWCIKLHDEVFSQPEFAAAGKGYVFVSLDYPHSDEAKAKVPNPARNQELAQKYAVQGYPTVLLMTADGDVFGRTGYERGGAAKYVESLGKLRESGRPALLAAIAVAKEFDASKDAARAAAAEKAVALVEKASEGGAWVEKLVPAMRAAVELDPENAKGLRLRAVKVLLKSGVFDEPIVAVARKLDPKNELGALEFVVLSQLAQVQDEESCRATAKAIEDLDALGPIKDKEVAQTLYANCAFWNLKMLGDPEKAKTFATKLKAVADPKNDQLMGLIREILGDDAGSHEGHEGHEGPEGGK